MQCGWMHRTDGPEEFRPVGETEVVNAVAVLSASGAYGRPRACAGIVGFADLRAGLDAVLEAHVAAGGGRFRGIRHIVALDDSIVPTTSVVPAARTVARPGLRRAACGGSASSASPLTPGCIIPS